MGWPLPARLFLGVDNELLRLGLLLLLPPLPFVLNDASADERLRFVEAPYALIVLDDTPLTLVLADLTFGWLFLSHIDASIRFLGTTGCCCLSGIFFD